ncbi:exodeoxyribonuclease VII large subunit [Planctomycetota bacterium]
MLRIYTVSQLNALIKNAITQTLPATVTVRGEIRDFKHHHSGHCYFSLKDRDSLLPCVMWSSRYKSVKFTPEDGMAILATGFVDVYTQGGKYQFYCDRLEPEGVGALQKAYEQMMAKLEAEGLFDDCHKQPLPAYARRIAVLTSESGAAWHDIADSIHQRWPITHLLLYPVPVQGEGAAAAIAQAIVWLNTHNDRLGVDLLIVGRGGGSLEDLWAFNEEVLARAIFASKIPIISAVGHEVDVTVTDRVADARASTPTKAGMVAVPDAVEVQEELTHYQQRLGSRVEARLELCSAQLDSVKASEVFRRPAVQVEQRYQMLDEYHNHMAEPLRRNISRTKDLLNSYVTQVRRIEPHRLLGQQQLDLTQQENMMNAALGSILARYRLAVETQAGHLTALNPKSVLSRGYSITRNQRTGVMVRQRNDARLGDTLITELANENFIESKVTK